MRRRRGRAGNQRPEPARRRLQDDHQNGAEDDGFVIAGRADEMRQDVLQLIAQDGDAGRAKDCAPDAAGAAEHGHQQIFGASDDAERTGADRALEMRVEPAGETGEHGCIDEQHQLEAGRSGPEGFRRRRAAPQQAHGAADAAVEQVAACDHRKDDRDPDSDEEIAGIGEREGAYAQRRNAGHAVVAAETFHVAEEIEERNAPGDRAKRQVVARQAHGEGANDQRREAGDGERNRQANPRRQAEVRCQHGARIGAESDEGRLPERRHAADARQQHEAERNEARDADVIEQRHPIGRQQAGEWRDENGERGDAGKEAHEAAHSSSSSTWPAVSERQTRTGMMAAKTIASL